jgi:lambda repressor-like predicted transcriptional regulator
MIVSDIPAKSGESLGLEASRNLKAKSLQIVSVGMCPKCHKLIVRPEPCNFAVCDCESVIEVALHPAIILHSNLRRRFNAVAKLVKREGISEEKLLNILLDTALKDYKAKQKWVGVWKKRRTAVVQSTKRKGEVCVYEEG